MTYMTSDDLMKSNVQLCWLALYSTPRLTLIHIKICDGFIKIKLTLRKHSQRKAHDN